MKLLPLSPAAKITKFTTEWRAVELQQLSFSNLMEDVSRTAANGKGD